MKGSGGGEIVQVQGGHIIRATGRKDRHSKVFTAKGPRDRRVRLSAHTAIEFYDVQDRLGYDRPSKAVDWLIKKAKSAIDKLAELPPFDPSASAAGVGANSSDVNMMEPGLDMAMADHSESSDYAIHLQGHLHGDNSPGGNGSNDAYVPQPIDLSPTMKPFFPVNTNPSVADGNSINFHDYGHLDMGSHTQDLCLSLHSFQDPSLIHGHQESDHHAPNSSHQHPHSSAHDHHTTLLSPSAAMAGFDPNSGGWGSQHPSDNGRFMRLVGWNNIASSDGNEEHNRGAAGGASFIYPSPLIQEQQQAAYLGQFGPYSLSERGTLQSTNNYTQMARSWDEDIQAVGRHEDHRKGHQMILHPSMTASFVAASACDGFTGFCFPSTGVGSHHGGEEFNGVVPNKASSAMSPKSSH